MSTRALSQPAYRRSSAARAAGAAPVAHRDDEEHLLQRCSCAGTCATCVGTESGRHDEREEEAPDIQRMTSARDAASVASDDIVTSLGAGTPIDRATRAFFEPRFGRDFSTVAIHTGPSAARSAAAVRARAFTAGRDIVFADGEYSPGTPPGRRLLAHELTHVVQQSGASGGGATSQVISRTPDETATELAVPASTPHVRSTVGRVPPPSSGLRGSPGDDAGASAHRADVE